ncbi:MAG: lipopolysaccharide transport periplasmic protein LptA [Methylobacter sp.]|nr:MAG: lipopolysaccharide transport periplasmic protein LptA [Methylobacter sp.]PPD24490.1 MAG: lipopolysaccharide transport periplasmic protein LptA [Methylobacter sp.]
MIQKNNNLTAGAIVFVMLLGSQVANALESDSEQPITIDSNTATYDDAKGVSIYTGNVLSVQGSIRVNSDRLVVYFIEGNPEKLVFTGVPAKFRQTPNPGEEDIIGQALTGEYYPKKNLLVLIDQAIVWQGNGTYSSKLIEYDSKNAIVKAGEKTSDSKRVHVVLQPKPKDKTKEESN